jgi:nucleoid DNA-binding protein
MVESALGHVRNEKEEGAMAKKKRARATRKSVSNKPPTRSEIYRDVAAKTGLARRHVVAVCDALTHVMVGSVKKYGTFNHLGLMKLTLVRKPAVAGGKLVRNPFTGEMIRQKARPASRTVRVRPLKAIKDML